MRRLHLYQPIRETELYQPILDYLALRGFPAKRNQSGVLHIGHSWVNLGAAGWPDIIGCLPPNGRLLGIEVKRPGEAPSEAQTERIGELQAAGALVLVVNGLEEVESALRGPR